MRNIAATFLNKWEEKGDHIEKKNQIIQISSDFETPEYVVNVM